MRYCREQKRHPSKKRLCPVYEVSAVNMSTSRPALLYQDFASKGLKRNPHPQQTPHKTKTGCNQKARCRRAKRARRTPARLLQTKPRKRKRDHPGARGTQVPHESGAKDSRQRSKKSHQSKRRLKSHEAAGNHGNEKARGPELRQGQNMKVEKASSNAKKSKHTRSHQKCSEHETPSGGRGERTRRSDLNHHRHSIKKIEAKELISCRMK